MKRSFVIVVGVAMAAGFVFAQEAAPAKPELPENWKELVLEKLLAEDAYAVDPAAPAVETLGYVRGNADEIEAAVDVAALRGSRAVSAARWYAKPFVAAREVGRAAAGAVVEHPVLTIAGGYLAVRGIQGKLDDDWDSLTGNDDDDGGDTTKTKSTSGTATAGEGGVVYSVNVGGDVNAPVVVIGRDNVVPAE